MSSIPPATDAPAPIETAPSAVVAEGPMFARLVGFVGLFFLVLGAVVVITTRAVGPRWLPEGFGFLFAGFGVALMLYHAVSDGEQEIRRLYGGLATGLLVLALVAAVLPGPFDGPSTEKAVGHYLLPWGLGAGLVALLFAVPFTRHETDETIRGWALTGMLFVGALLCAAAVLAGVANPNFLAGTGLGLAILGLGFVCAYLSQVDTSDGLGYAVALTLAAVGGAVAFYAFGRTVFPTVLADGPSVLRKTNQTLDMWKVAGRAAVILAFLGIAAWGALGKMTNGARAALTAAGLIGAAVFVAATVSTPLPKAPQPFLVPGGLILGAIGLAFLAVGLGASSDNTFVTLTRRELSSYFLSPIGYLVLAGMVGAQWLGYIDLVGKLARMSTPPPAGAGAAPEPIVQFYIVAIFPIFALTLMVPALTMRLVAEEKRTGTLEVMLTAPVNEWSVILSKFFATWFFFMVCWLPSGLLLIALRLEAGPFDYRPLLGFYVALAASGAGFVAMGLFFSVLTKNQIVAAVLTFVGMVFFLACYILSARDLGLGQSIQVFLGKLAYITLWSEALSGQLPIRDVILWASLAVFFLILSIKVLETRRWS
jgi:ABC-type transport system involved in multi-copper enzyme maturation permease subunit